MTTNREAALEVMQTVEHLGDDVDASLSLTALVYAVLDLADAVRETK